MFYLHKIFVLCGTVSILHVSNIPQEPLPLIKKTYTNLPEKENWVVVPKGTKTITIHVEADHTETVLFWLIPTGTATWQERKLIGYDTDPTDGWSLKWSIDGLDLHNHIQVQALSHTNVSNDLFNIISERK
ncbi:hypothetical protein MUG87_18610 [Ectobacillus sp. JY-23]|jgi:hypothetical protein|uniref:hypothetical protein n=1 Tax=Ectobacillus sp. JY-23 TaxID=2933872 RepID=UPI001FF16FEA|nr:hypothetical protein [Ectobacillus sp. JY-23]UOY92407.1 hypothetical protein MUG87_18610 [Ectobacillus sp. JY-23]